MSGIVKLPGDVLFLILQRIGRVSQIALALTCHTLFDAVSQKTFDVFNSNHDFRRELLITLERDPPDETIYCPGCNKLHRIPTTSSQDEPDLSRKATDYKDLWKCVRFDRQNEVDQTYGQGLHFYQARMALKLHRVKHPNARQYLRSFDCVQLQQGNESCFLRREVRIARETVESEKPELALRGQHWLLLSDEDVTTHYDDLPNFGQTLICHHMPVRKGINSMGLSMAEKLKAGTQVAGNQEIDQFLSYYGHPSYARRIVSYKDEHRAFTSDQIHGTVTYRSEGHCFSPLYRCPRCMAEFRVDVLRIPSAEQEDANDGGMLKGSLQSSSAQVRWAIVTTKWIRLGPLEEQDSAGWQRPACVEKINRQVIRLRDRLGPFGMSTFDPGDAFAAFEGCPYFDVKDKAKEVRQGYWYIPEWSAGLGRHLRQHAA